MSGSQLEVNDIKNSFERGKRSVSLGGNTQLSWFPQPYLVSFSGNDPLTDDESNHDINSVAGVLKLYFRGLENPLFPKERFTELLACISKSSTLLLVHNELINDQLLTCNFSG